jgi:hypothetical protein
MAEKSSMTRVPSEGAIAEARKHPGGWVYEIHGEYGPNDHVPAHAVSGAWKVSDEGRIIGEFIPNPNFKEVTRE